MKQPRIHIRWYIIADVAICILTWLAFYYLRTVIYDYSFTIPPGFYLGLLLYTVGWISLHFLSGSYNSLYQKSRITEIFRTLIVCVIGSLFLLFFFVLKNPHGNSRYYYLEFYSLLLPYFFSTLTSRMIFLQFAKNQLRSKQVFFNALLLGSGKKGAQFYDAFSRSKEQSGYRIAGFVNTNGTGTVMLPGNIREYKGLGNLTTIIREEHIEEIIIAVEKNERDELTHILQNLSDIEVNIKITPDTVDIISGALQTSNVMGVPLIDIHSGLLPDWQQNIKRVIDILFSVTGIIILSPLYAYTILRLKISSPGPIFYSQERIGYKGRRFTMYKFRSMIEGAEANGPQLSTEDDERITKWGKVMRKWRLDELPQLWNIIKGEMSLVGPRPERKFYIDQIVARHPEFKYIYKVKPGLTSWGMVKFGYASSVDEMIQRMQYDLLYVENVSLTLDFEIMLYTIQIILSGKGK